MNLWEWFTATASVDSLVTALGLGSLAILFATDRIITKGQHARRVEDLVSHHNRERTDKDGRITDIRSSRESWKEAARVERERADKATDSVGEMADTLKGILHVFESLDHALPNHAGGDRAQ